MSDYVRITDRKIEMTDEGVEALMSDYIPTTEEVREQYCLDDGLRYTEHEIGFDRWLAEVKAKVWEQGYIIGISTAWHGAENAVNNPYRRGEKE